MNTWVIGGNAGRVDPLVGRDGLGVVFAFVRVGCGALVGVVAATSVGVMALVLGDASVVPPRDGGGVGTEAMTGRPGLVGVGIASTIGVTAELSCAGLTAEPTIRPKARRTITATPVTVGDGSRTAVSAFAS
jgi:hypothetical protein